MYFLTKITRYSFFSIFLGLFLITSFHSSFSQTEESLNEISEEDLELIEEYLEQAESLFEQRFTEATLFHYDKVLEIDPLNIDALIGKALVYDLIGANEDAILHYEMVLEIEPDNELALQGLTLSLENQDESDEVNSFSNEDMESEEILETFEEISDESLDVLQDSFDKAEDLLESENYEEAISFYDMVLEIDSSDIDALNGKALALASIGKHEEAISFYDMVLEIDSSDIDALFGKAISLESLGNIEESLLNLEKAEELINPQEEFRELPEIQNENIAEEIAESDQILFVIISIFIIIILIIIILDFLARKRKSLDSKNTQNE